MSEALSAEAVEAIERERMVRLRDGTRVCCVLGVLAFVSYTLLDPLLVPAEQVRTLLVARAAIIAPIVGVLLLTRTPFGERQVEALAVVTCLLVAIGVIAMTVLTGGAGSPYHQALLLTFMGASLVMPWRVKSATFAFAASLVLYNLALFVTDSWHPLVSLLINNGILITSAAICVTATRYSGLLRTEELRSRYRLASANKRLTVLDRSKNRFFANLSHEFRTPLNLSLAPVEALLEGTHGELDPVVSDHLRLVHRNNIRLLRLVDDLLELTRLEASGVQVIRQAVDVQRMVIDLTAEVAPLAQRKDIELVSRMDELDEGAQVYGDVAQLERVLLNLLANALKFTDAGGLVQVVARSRDSGVELEVCDDGMGIPSEHLGRVFDRFHQVDDSSTRRHGGTGIGLALSREIVELHGGHIQLDSELGEGTRVRFWLPEGELGAGTPREPEAVPGLPEWHDRLRRSTSYRLQGVRDASERRIFPRSSERRFDETILVVEDNPDMTRFIAGLLAPEFGVMCAPDGEVGLRLATSRQPDLIISDVAMPRMNGFELLIALKEQAATRSIPTIMLTARDASRDRVAARQGGADVYLTKPFNARELIASVRGLLSKQESRVREARTNQDEALGLLAQGVAHEVLNPLGFIQSALFLMREAALSTEPVDREEVEQFHAAGREGVERVRAAVEELRSLSGSGGLAEPEPTQVDQAIARIITLASTGSTVKIEHKPGSTQPVALRPGQLERVIINLVVNAMQAGAGSLTVLTADGAGLVVVRVQDDGPGIAAADRERVFQPFFTTKGPEEGTGLGLALCRQIIRRHGGSLELVDGPRGGAEFRIELPMLEDTKEQISAG